MPLSSISTCVHPTRSFKALEEVFSDPWSLEEYFPLCPPFRAIFSTLHESNLFHILVFTAVSSLGTESLSVLPLYWSKDHPHSVLTSDSGSGGAVSGGSAVCLVSSFRVSEEQLVQTQRRVGFRKK